MKHTIAASLLLLALPLAGCQTANGSYNKQSIGAVTGAAAGGLVGSRFGSGGGRAAAVVGGALLGGILGSAIGANLDQADQQRLYSAQYSALESGTNTQWKSPDSGNYGYVNPGPAYQVNNTNCRDYTHTIYINGAPETARGTACRQADGTWKPVA